MIPNLFPDFIFNYKEVKITGTGVQAHLFHGDLYLSEENRVCSCCGGYMELHQTFHVLL